jgi:hypothetical protein
MDESFVSWHLASQDTTADFILPIGGQKFSAKATHENVEGKSRDGGAVCGDPIANMSVAERVQYTEDLLFLGDSATLGVEEVGIAVFLERHEDLGR